MEPGGRWNDVVTEDNGRFMGKLLSLRIMSRGKELAGARQSEKEKSPHAPKRHADFPNLKPCLLDATLPIPGESMCGFNQRQVFWLAIHSPGAFPIHCTSGQLPFVLAHSGGSAGEWPDNRASPLFPIKPLRAP